MFTWALIHICLGWRVISTVANGEMQRLSKWPKATEQASGMRTNKPCSPRALPDTRQIEAVQAQTSVRLGWSAGRRAHGKAYNEGNWVNSQRCTSRSGSKKGSGEGILQVLTFLEQPTNREAECCFLKGKKTQTGLGPCLTFYSPSAF